MPSPSGCAKCGGEMETGFLLDRDGTILTRTSSAPSPGVPLLWAPIAQIGMSTPSDLEGQLEVDALRCTSCGFLELYAGLGAGK